MCMGRVRERHVFSLVYFCHLRCGEHMLCYLVGCCHRMQMCYCHVRGYLMMRCVLMGCGQGKWMKEGIGSFKLEMGSFLR